MTEYGLWTTSDAGFVETQLYSVEEANEAIERHASAAAPEDQQETREDLSVVELCPEHEEQPKDGCEECETEELSEGDECSCGGTILADGACDNDDHDDREDA